MTAECGADGDIFWEEIISEELISRLFFPL
jgi:hypothetical protein